MCADINSEISETMCELNKYTDHKQYFSLNQKVTIMSQKTELDLINKKRTKLNRDRNDKCSDQYRPWDNRKTRNFTHVNTHKPDYNRQNRVPRTDTNIRPLMDIQVRSPKYGTWQRKSTFVNQKFHKPKSSRPIIPHSTVPTSVNSIPLINTVGTTNRQVLCPEIYTTPFSTPTNKTQRDVINTPKNKTQRDLIKIRSTIERLRKEYAEKFPEDNSNIGNSIAKGNSQPPTVYNLFFSSIYSSFRSDHSYGT